MIAAGENVFDFTLAAELEATAPPEARGIARDEVRLLVTDPQTDRIAHAHFRDLPQYLRAGDLLVVNDSATIAAAVDARMENGEAIALHFSSPLARDWWIVEPRVRSIRPQTLHLPRGATVRLTAKLAETNTRLWLAQVSTHEPVADYLRAAARPIHYRYAPHAWPLEAYQTIFAREPGSVEMPSAGRPFSQRVLAALADRSVGVAAITLHCGVASTEHDELPPPERFNVPQTTVAKIAATRRHGGRVVAVGTTVVRALESASTEGKLRAVSGVTELVIDASRRVRSVDGILTGLHEPRASHLHLLEAFAPAGHLARAYDAALGERYLWHEFGDVHLLLQGSLAPLRNLRRH